MITTRKRVGSTWLVRFVASAFLSAPLVVAPNSSSADVVADAAGALNAAIERSEACQSGTVRVGVFPFDDTQLPITADNAYRLYEAVLSDLIETAPACAEYLDGRGAYLTLNYLAHAGTFRENGQSHRSEIQEILSDVDFVLDGTILDDGGAGYSALFRLTNFKTGSAVGRADFDIPEEFHSNTCGVGGQPLSVAMPRIAEALAERAHDMERLTVIGGYYEHSDAQTEFSRYLEEQIAAALTAEMEDKITGRALRVDFLREQEATSLRLLRGVTLTPREFDEEATHAASSAPVDETEYRMQLRYWPCEGDTSARVGITLVSEDDRTFSEMTNVRLDDLPSGMALHPPETPIEANWGPDGAYTFQMTSQRGPNPIFRPGELFETLFRVGQDAWLYCFYTDSNGEMLQLLPNPFQADDPNANFYAGGRVHLYPDPERLPRPDPFDIVINDDTVGTEVFQCIAASRDVTDDLPEELRGMTLEPVPPRYAFRLRQIFEDLVEARIAQASVTVTVLP